MRTLVTGIGGFVAPYLAEHLKQNDFQVFGLSKDIKEDENNFNVDLTDFEKVYQVINKIKPGYIFHLAAISSVKLAKKFPELAFEVNVKGTENIMKSVVKSGIDPRILITSTADVYGIPKKTPIREEHPVNPISVYAKSKLEQEAIALEYFKNKNIKVVISRSFIHTGPGQPQSFVCSDFAKQIAEIEKGKQGKEPVIRVGNLDVKRDFSDVRDIVKAYLLALQKCQAGEFYNICSEKAYSIEQIVQILLSFSEKKIKIKQEKERMRKNDIPILLGDCSKFKKATAWKPQIPFENTLKDLLDYWRERV
jgi:GDP-4-dehydro-6-deoxy-D-mannose reductase